MNPTVASSESAVKTAPVTKTVQLSRARRTAILKALADPHRLKLLERISTSTSPLGCAEALSTLAISPATLSHHIKELEAAGLVHVERAGKFIHLSLRAEVWSALIASLASLGQPRSTRR
jgi:ArsR family transcriptional regulator